MAVSLAPGGHSWDSTDMLDNQGVGEPFKMSIVLVCVGVIAVILNTLVITRFGYRRTFLITGLILCGCVQLM